MLVAEAGHVSHGLVLAATALGPARPAVRRGVRRPDQSGAGAGRGAGAVPPGGGGGAMRTRRGFTLLEVMIALVLTSVVALMAYASAKVTADASATLDDGLRAGAERPRRARDAPRPAAQRAAAAPARRHLVRAAAATRSSSRPPAPSPLDPDHDWYVSDLPRAAGLEIDARALGRGPASAVGSSFPTSGDGRCVYCRPVATEWKDLWTARTSAAGRRRDHAVDRRGPIRPAAHHQAVGGRLSPWRKPTTCAE